ncbi:MAG TPA: hypothetical protein VLI72_12265 [Methylibium sp.]|nr:hypothetical protein [Methylibium sp.]
MTPRRAERALVLVKAFPQPSQKYEETVCCAGLGPEGDFVRLYPVRFRQLRPEQRFDRWDVIEYQAERPRQDHRPESRHVSEDSIRIAQRAGELSDEERVRLWAPHVSGSLEALKASNVATGRSLGIVRPEPGSVRFHARATDDASDADRRMQDAYRQVSLMGEQPLPALKVKFEFSYSFTSAGRKHRMKIHDWEVQAAFLAYERRYGDQALAVLTEEYEQHIPARHLHLVMGTMQAHPRQFIVIGLLRSGIDPELVLRQAPLL